MEACGDCSDPRRESRQRSAPPSPSLSASNTAFVISSTNSGMPSVRSMISCRMLGGQQLIPGDAVDDGSDFALAEPIECESGNVRPSNPRRVKLRSVA